MFNLKDYDLVVNNDNFDFFEIDNILKDTIVFRLFTKDGCISKFEMMKSDIRKILNFCPS